MASARFTSKAPETYLGGYDGQVWLQPISWTSAPMSALVVRFVHPASTPRLIPLSPTAYYPVSSHCWRLNCGNGCFCCAFFGFLRACAFFFNCWMRDFLKKNSGPNSQLWAVSRTFTCIFRFSLLPLPSHTNSHPLAIFVITVRHTWFYPSLLPLSVGWSVYTAG